MISIVRDLLPVVESHPDLEHHPRQPHHKVTVSFLVDCCGTCARPMWPRAELSPSFYPYRTDLSSRAQAFRQLLPLEHQYQYNGRHICVDCAAQDKANFVCFVCKTPRPTSQIIRTVEGDPGEHACMDCYKTTPACEWEEAVRACEERHRYDFE